MEALKIFFLAVLQGVTEFLPVSSSGHLAILGKLIGFDAPGVRVEIMLHFGTLISVVIYYRERLGKIIAGVFKGRREDWLTVAMLALGCIPAGIVYLLAGDFLEEKFDGDVRFVGCMLLVTGVVLLSLRFLPDGKSAKIGPFRALLIGCAQAVAMMPGISRSGSTIAAARYLGVSGRDAADFSFLMSLPILFAAAVLQLAKDFAGDVPAEGDVGAGLLAAAVVVSAVTGYFAIRFLMRTLIGRKFWIFGIYCLAAGLVAVCL